MPDDENFGGLALVVDLLDAADAVHRRRQEEGLVRVEMHSNEADATMMRNDDKCVKRFRFERDCREYVAERLHTDVIALRESNGAVRLANAARGFPSPSFR